MKNVLSDSSKNIYGKLPYLFLALCCNLAFLLGQTSEIKTTPFLKDSALVHLKYFASQIGPRTMGSPQEYQAMQYALKKFREYGLQETSILPLEKVLQGYPRKFVNTTTGAAYGILRGTTRRTIVLGAHIDSSEPTIAGANDNASGSAVILELARVLSRRKNESTIIFALFGGEEQGLQGSREFVRSYENMNEVELMIQIDMANGSEMLMPLVYANGATTPHWLLEAAHEESLNLGYGGLSYPMHFFDFLRIMPGGGIGSDHQPFLEEGIPAIDFTSSPNDPIHTPQDNLENFIPWGLKRSGDIAYQLVTRFDTGIPKEEEGEYYHFQISSYMFIIPFWLIYFFAFGSVVFSFYVIIKVRKKRIIEAPRRVIPGIKLFLLMLLIQIFVWLSESVVGFMKGTRVPWTSMIEEYIVLGFVAGLLGIWVALRLSPSLTLSHDPYRYFLRSIVVLILFSVFFGFVAPHILLYTGWALFFISLSLFVKAPLLRLVLWMVSPHFMFRLIFSEGFDFLAHSMQTLPLESSSFSLIVEVFYVVIFSVWSFPFLLAFAALWMDKEHPLRINAFLKSRVTGIIIGLAYLTVSIVLAFQPTYSHLRKQNIAVTHQYNGNNEPSILTLTSNDYLRDTRILVGRNETLIDENVCTYELQKLPPLQKEPLVVKRKMTREKISDSVTTFELVLTMHFTYRPYTVSVRYFAKDGSLLFFTSSPSAWTKIENGYEINWYSFPDSVMVVPVEFQVHGTENVIEEIEAVFLEKLIPVEIKKEDSNIEYRSRITLEKTIL